MRIIGVMSGSSLDGLDLVSVNFIEGSSLKWEIEASDTVTIPTVLSESLRLIINQSAFEIAKTESKYSKFIAKSVNDFKTQLPGKPICASIHGHTVLHLPEIQTSWQLLNGGMCAALTGMDIVCDFRNSDMSFGGQGTPMAVIADRDLFPGYDYYINLGGIANISYIEKGIWKAFDIAPCNQVMNYYAMKKGMPFDKDGKFASKGSNNEKLLKTLLDDPFIVEKPPKSLDNTWIKDYWIPLIESFKLSIEDVLHTYNAFLIHVINREIRKSSGSILMTGGGAKNSYFFYRFKSELGGNIDCPKLSGEIIDFKESILMAYMAYLRLNGLPNFLNTASGAKKNSIGGAWYVGGKTC